MAEQSASNHARFAPLFHFSTAPLLLLFLLFSLYTLITAPGLGTVAQLVLAAGVFLLGSYARLSDCKLQDRIIRLEMQVRLHRVLPEELRSRIDELTLGQLIALRFASDEELPELTRRTLAGELADRTAIKQAITNWRADHLRV